MLNYWWVTRPKRKLNSVPEVLAAFADLSLNQEWDGQRDSHLAYEDALEAAGLKRKGERRDQTGGGARTYKAWLVSLGLIFAQESTGKIKLTLAGEAIMIEKARIHTLGPRKWILDRIRRSAAIVSIWSEMLAIVFIWCQILLKIDILISFF